MNGAFVLIKRKIRIIEKKPKKLIKIYETLPNLGEMPGIIAASVSKLIKLQENNEELKLNYEKNKEILLDTIKEQEREENKLVEWLRIYRKNPVLYFDCLGCIEKEEWWNYNSRSLQINNFLAQHGVKPSLIIPACAPMSTERRVGNDFYNNNKIKNLLLLKQIDCKNELVDLTLFDNNAKTKGVEIQPSLCAHLHSNWDKIPFLIKNRKEIISHGLPHSTPFSKETLLNSLPFVTSYKNIKRVGSGQIKLTTKIPSLGRELNQDEEIRVYDTYQTFYNG